MIDTMFFTKLVGAVCGTLLIFLVGKWAVDDLILAGNNDEDPAFVVAEGNDADADVEDDEALAQLAFSQALATADATAGQNLYAQCRACHSLEVGNNGLGPYLANVMGREIGTAQGFGYSGALPDGEWTVENMSAFLEDPRGFAPGTSMAYNGMPALQDRINMIAYLAENSADFEMPDPGEVAAAPAAPAEDDEHPIIAAYANADAERGAQAWNQCRVCHVATEERNGLGPHLVDLVGREVNSVAGFNYSGNLPDGVWTLENLSDFLTDPRGYAPGTTMAFNGIPDIQTQADLILYIEQSSPNFVATEEAPAEVAPAEEAPAVEEEPVVEAPVEEAPVVEAPVEEAPVVEAPVEEEAVEEAEAPAPAVENGDAPILVALETADIDDGAAAFAARNCGICHSIDEPVNRVGPHLVGVVGRPIGSVDGANYSGNLPDGNWTAEMLDAFLSDPAAFAPGTSMAIPPIESLEERANIIAYMQAAG